MKTFGAMLIWMSLGLLGVSIYETIQPIPNAGCLDNGHDCK